MQQSGDKQNIASKHWEKLRLPDDVLDKYPKNSLVVMMFDEVWKKRTDTAYDEVEKTVDVGPEHIVQIKVCCGAMYSEKDDRTLYQIVVCKRNPLRAHEEMFRAKGMVGMNRPEVKEDVDKEFAKQRWWPYLVMDVSGIPGNDVGLAIDAAREAIESEIVPQISYIVLKDQAAYGRYVLEKQGRVDLPPPWFMEKKTIVTTTGGLKSGWLSKFKKKKGK